ncbi:tRNA preQ1(34) S-adenosylmethionine ribosyltransferase-isomerase QueA [Anaerolineales bacterium]
MDIRLFDYDLPERFIAQFPVEPRDSSKLMVLDPQSQQISHHIFTEFPDYLQSGDVIVLNDTRVIPARLHATKASGGKAEILLLKQKDPLHWYALVGGKRIRIGSELAINQSDVRARIVENLEGSERLVRFSQEINPWLEDVGEIPLPPYIHERLDEPERYQTIFNRIEGSAAAPTAGLHFTPELLMALRDKGVQFAYVTLHIGLDTFQPVKSETVEAHQIHSEYARLSAENAKIINEAKLAGKRVITIGTTATRVIESAGIISEGGDPANPSAPLAACPWRPVTAFEDYTRLYIYPGYRWRVVDAMLTNFHLPKSSLLMMISAFAGREFILAAYEEAKANEYRFFSFGDAMLIQNRIG